MVDPATSRLVTMPAGIPELTLGWEAIHWASKYLRHPNGPRAGQRWQHIDSQAHFLLWWYAVDSDGRWLFRHGARRLAKGVGKSPFAGLLGLVELCAPVRVDSFDPKMPGGVVGKPVAMPWVQIAAVSASQTANTMRMVRALAAKGSRVAVDYKLDTGITKIYKPPNGLLEVITSSAATAEGAEVSFVVEDEALALDTAIPTPSGWTTVADLRMGDTIYGSAGPVEITHLTPVFTGRLCSRVTFSDHTSLVVDDGHLWLSKLVRSAARPKVRSTREMVEDSRKRKFSVPRMKPFDGPDVDLPVDPYVLGLWLGDGSTRWASLTAGRDEVDFILKEVQNRGVPAAKVVKSGNARAATISLRGNVNGDLYTKDGSSFRGGLVKLGVLNNKHIPHCLLRASRAQRLDLLRGLMDSDGWIGEVGAVVFVNSRKSLVDGIIELIRSLGYLTQFTSRRDSRWKNNPIVYKVAFRPDSECNPFLMPRKASKVRAPSLRRWKTIISIEPVESVPVKCIEVDSEDHLFVAGDGWTLTHNTEHWLPATGGPVLAETLDRNLAKSGSRAMETSNAWEPGLGSVAEATYDAWVMQEEGRTRGKSKILYDARIAPADTDLADEESLLKGLAHAYGDCWWVDLEVLKERVWSPQTRPEVARRFYLNQPTASEESWVSPMEWAACVDTARLVHDDEEIVMFFDGSKSRDATALLGCAMSDGHVFALGVWEPDTSHDSDSVVPVASVDAAVAQAFDRWNVLAFFADVQEWEGYVKTTWPERYRDKLLVWSSPNTKESHPIAWDMRTRTYDFTMAVELTYEDIVARKFTHDGDSRVARHVINAHRRPNRWGVSIGKETKDSPRKVDAAVCVVGARMVRRLVMSSPEWLKRSGSARAGRVFGF
jgi:hypothetical protein